MNIYINRVLDSIETQCTLHELLLNKNISSDLIAVALNNEFIPRALFKTTFIQNNDRIDLIIPMQGG